LVVLLVFGAKRLPEIACRWGDREFKKSFSETSDAITSPTDTTTRQLDAPAQPPVSSEPKRLSQ
jgi:Sec-independent protein translocase protein TatA